MGRSIETIVQPNVEVDLRVASGCGWAGLQNRAQIEVCMRQTLDRVQQAGAEVLFACHRSSEEVRRRQEAPAPSSRRAAALRLRFRFNRLPRAHSPLPIGPWPSRVRCPHVFGCGMRAGWSSAWPLRAGGRWHVGGTGGRAPANPTFRRSSEDREILNSDNGDAGTTVRSSRFSVALRLGP